MADFAAAAFVVSAIAQVGRGAMQYKASEQRKEALDLMSEQEKLQTQERTIANYDQTLKMLDSQKVMLSTRGVAAGSPSFEALQRATMEIGGRKQQIIDTEDSIYQRNIAIEKENVANKFIAELFGDATDFGVLAYGAKKSFPKLSSE